MNNPTRVIVVGAGVFDPNVRASLGALLEADPPPVRAAVVGPNRRVTPSAYDLAVARSWPQHDNSSTPDIQGVEVARASYTDGMALRIPPSEPLTVDDIYDPPDDGHRYELVDGCLIVTPAPSMRHQRASKRLLVLLDEALPPDLEVLCAPFDWIVDEHTKLQPDLLVFRRTDVDEDALRVPTLLAIEVLSPSTRQIDLGTKKLAIAAAGAPHYWVVDPLTPSITAFDLVDGDFVEAGIATGEGALTLDRPFRITVVPARLVE